MYSTLITLSQASAPIAPPQPPYGYGSPSNVQQPPVPPQVPVPPQQHLQQPYPQGPVQSPGAPPLQNGGGKGPRNNAVHSATTSMETVERAIGDLRVDGGPSNPPHGGRGGRRGGGRHADAKTADIKVPTTDFDFESSNARFDKSALNPNMSRTNSKSGEVTPNEQAEQSVEGEGEPEKEKPEAPKAYNPKASFFDSLTPGGNEPPAGGRGRGGRRGGGGRNRREEERERNVATFGEPGGIGLMGPGAYVGGWGGYGRRGGGRGRRGGGNPRQ